jgi:hypothetical protein
VGATRGGGGVRAAGRGAVHVEAAADRVAQGRVHGEKGIRRVGHAAGMSWAGPKEIVLDPNYSKTFQWI